MRIATTKELRKVVRRSERSSLTNLPNELFWEEIDLLGHHVLKAMPMPGEYRFVRTFALCKLKNVVEPAEVWIDVIADDWMQLRKEAHAE